MTIKRVRALFNWRVLLVRIVVNALALAITAALMPGITFVDKSIWVWLFMALVLGILNALVKPLVQTLTLQFIFVTFGLVIVLVNTLILLLLSLLFPSLFAVESLFWALVGGLVLGLLSSFLESLLGLSVPIVPDEPAERRRRLEQQAQRAGSLGATSEAAGTEDQGSGLDTDASEQHKKGPIELPASGNLYTEGEDGPLAPPLGDTVSPDRPVVSFGGQATEAGPQTEREPGEEAEGGAA